MSGKAPRFRLDRRLAPGAAVQGAALRQLDHAIDGIRRGDPRGIHEARKSCKRVRALLRLMRPALGASFRTQNRRVRDAARAISTQRDADVLLETARGLGLGVTAAKPPRRDPAARRRALALLRDERRRADRWPIGELARETLNAGLVEGYRRARRAGKQARKRERADALHEWRKQVKYHRYHAEAAASLYPRLARRARAADDLAETLGRHHDLELLADAIIREPQRFGPPVANVRALKRVRREQQRIAARAFRQGKALFEDKPAAWLAREGHA